MAVDCLALALVAGLSPAPDRVVVEPLQVDGELPASWRETAQRRLEEGLGRDSLLVETTPAAGCDDAACRSALRERSGAGYVVKSRLAVDASGRDYAVDLRVVSLESGEEVARIEGRCELCGIAEAVDTLAARAAGVQGALERLSAGETSLAVPPTPPPRLDPDSVEPAPQPAGPARPEPARAPARTLFIAGGITAGLGLAALAAGGALLALDGRPKESNCQSDPAGNCRFLYGTQAGGIASVSVGAALTIGGAILVGLGLRRRERNKTTAGGKLHNGLAVSW